MSSQFDGEIILLASGIIFLYFVFSWCENLFSLLFFWDSCGKSFEIFLKSFRVAFDVVQGGATIFEIGSSSLMNFLIVLCWADGFLKLVWLVQCRPSLKYEWLIKV
jgi:hypothetical protein